MSFLAPLFLAGSLLVIGPVIAHLIRRSTRDNVRFSDTRFLSPSSPRVSKRSRIENPWLLLLRCLAVLVLCAGFARPFANREIPIQTELSVHRHVVVVLDESASMQRRDMWENALQHVRAVAADLRDGDQFAIVAAGLHVTPIITSERWRQTHRLYRRQLLESAIDYRRPGWGPTPLDSGIEAALDELAVMAETSRGTPAPEIVVISDLTAGASLSGLAGRDWPPHASVRLVRPAIGRRANASIEALGWTITAEGNRAARLRLGYDGAAGDTFRLRILDAITGRDVANARNVPLGGGETRIVVIEVPENVVRPVLFEISGDLEPYDNQTWLLPPQRRQFALPYLGESDVSDLGAALFYISRAVGSWKDPAVELLPISPGSPDPYPDSPLLVVDGALDAAGVSVVRDRLGAGAFALILLNDPTMVPTAAAIAGETGWSAGVLGRGNAIFGEIDFQHPLFVPFADPRFSNFAGIRFWNPVPLRLPEDSAGQIVARFDDGSAAVTEHPVGDGRLIVWAGGWSTKSGQWVLSSKFVPWLQNLVERAAGGQPRPSMADPANIARLTGGAPALWRKAGSEAAFSEQAPEAPGLYELQQGGAARWVAIHVPPTESNNEPLPLDAWEQLGVPLQTEERPAQTPAGEVRTTTAPATVVENEQQFWRWALLAAIVLLGTESFAAMRAARRSAGLAT